MIVRFLPMMRRGHALAVALFACSMGVPGLATAGPSCSGVDLIDETLASGARWQMCWEERTREGIILSEIYYSPPGGAERKVMEQLNLAQIHVPYDDDGARFHDITDYGAGGGNLQNLSADDCPGGRFLVDGTKNAACQRVLPRGSAFDALAGQRQGEMLSIFSVSPIGAYNYIPTYEFEDDGAIQIRIGATGSLQRFDYNLGDNTPTAEAWPLDSGGDRHGISHIHNYYYRMDFDLAGTPDNDVVEQIDVVADATAALRTTSVTPFVSEAAADVAPSSLRTWRIREGAGGVTNAHGHLVGYELVPLESGHRDEGPSFEPFTHDDFYVTRYDACEQYASHNDNHFPACGDHLQDFVSGESLANEDIVVWYGMTFHHIPRDEDETRMHAHWNGFRLEPRNWHDVTPTSVDVATCAPDALDFETFALEPYGQDGDGQSVSMDGGRTLKQTGNSWKRSVGTYEIQTGTELHFEFASSMEGEIHSIGFDADQTLNGTAAHFDLHGTQNWSGSGRIDTFAGAYGGAGAYESFQVTLSDHLPNGTGLHLVLGNDQDNGPPTNDGRFRCVRIVQPDAAPVWTDPGAQTHAEGDVVALTLDAFDPNGASVTYSVSPPLPSGLSLDANSGAVTGTLDYTAAAGSPYSLTATADDGSETTDLALSWTVTNTNRAPVWADPGAQTNGEGDVVSLTLVATDADLESVTYSVSPPLPPGLSLDANSGAITGTIGYTAAAGSPYTLTATATDGIDPIDQIFSWTVTNTNRAPEWSDPGPQSGAEGDVVNLTLVATDPDGEGVTFSAPGLPTGLTLDAGTGAITGTIDYDASVASPYSITATATDGVAPVDQIFSWTVANTNRPPVWIDPGAQQHDEGSVVSLQLDAPDADLEDTVTFGIVGLPAGLSLDSATGLIEGTIAYSAYDDGPVYAVTASASDGTVSVDQGFSWTIDAGSPPEVPLLPTWLRLALVVLLGLGGVAAVRRS